MKNLLDYTQNELANIIKPKFRAKQIYEWIYKKNAKSFDEMSNLPKDIREYLKGEIEKIRAEIKNENLPLRTNWENTANDKIERILEQYEINQKICN